MSHSPREQREAQSSAAVRCASAAASVLRSAGRLARSMAGSPLGRRLMAGVVLAAGWLLGVVLCLFGTATPAEATAVHSSPGVAGSVSSGHSSATRSAGSPFSDVGGTVTEDSDGFPTATKASADAEAMAGRTIDGLTSQSRPLFPPTPGDQAASGAVPQGNGGPIMFWDGGGLLVEPHFIKLPAPWAAIRPPKVRTAADDPSFSPD